MDIEGGKAAIFMLLRNTWMPNCPGISLRSFAAGETRVVWR